MAELDWTAFRYIVGELSADEACRFEEQLAVDQLAREAVVAAVRLTSVVAQGFPAEQPAEQVISTDRVAGASVRQWRSGRQWSRIGWLVGTMAACVAFFLLVRDVRDVPPEDVAAGRIQKLATAWVASRSAESDTSGLESTIHDPLAHDSVAHDSATHDTATAVTPSPEADDMSTVPDWLLAAVSEKVMSEQADAPKPAPERAIEN